MTVRDELAQRVLRYIDSQPAAAAPDDLASLRTKLQRWRRRLEELASAGRETVSIRASGNVVVLLDGGAPHLLARPGRAAQLVTQLADRLEADPFGLLVRRNRDGLSLLVGWGDAMPDEPPAPDGGLP